MENEFRKIQLRTILLFSALILGITIYLTLFLAGQSNYILRKNASGLIAASNRQLELNIDGYLSRIQRTASQRRAGIPLHSIGNRGKDTASAAAGRS